MRVVFFTFGLIFSMGFISTIEKSFAQMGPVASATHLKPVYIARGGSDNGSGGISPESDPTPLGLDELEVSIDDSLKSAAKHAGKGDYFQAYNVLSNGIRIVFIDDTVKRKARGFTSKALGWTINMIEILEDERYFVSVDPFETVETRTELDTLNYEIRYRSLEAQAQYIQTTIRNFDRNTWFKGIASNEDSEDFVIAVLELTRAHFEVAEKVFAATQKLSAKEQQNNPVGMDSVIHPKEDLFIAFMSQHLAQLHKELNNPETLGHEKIRGLIKDIGMLNFCLNNMVARSLITLDLQNELGFVNFHRTFARIQRSVEKNIVHLKTN